MAEQWYSDLHPQADYAYALAQDAKAALEDEGYKVGKFHEEYVSADGDPGGYQVWFWYGLPDAVLPDEGMIRKQPTWVYIVAGSSIATCVLSLIAVTIKR